jgi:hypothetical protein
VTYLQSDRTMIAAPWRISQPTPVVGTTLQGIEFAVRDRFGRVVAIENWPVGFGADNPERLCKRIW